MRNPRTILLSAALACLLSPLATALAATPIEPADQERVAKNKQTIFSRLKRDKPTYRGDKPGEMRMRWEWYDKVIRNYIYEKRLLIKELSANEKYELRPQWVFKDMKVTFQELFALGPEDDDKLVPILSHQALLEMVPRASLEGLTLLGKHGETKGAITRKYRVSTVTIYGVQVLSTRLEYKEGGGKVITAFSPWSYDAFTLRWKDLKDRIVDDFSEAKGLEDLDLERDALMPEPTPGTQ